MSKFNSINGNIPVVSSIEIKVLRDCQNALTHLGGELLLFGSRARRDHRDDSDFDFWLRLPKELHAEAYHALPKCDVAIGLLLLEPNEILPFFDATLPDQIKVTEILKLADKLGPFAIETQRKPPKMFTIDVSTPDSLLSALLYNFKLERVNLGYQIIEICPGHPFRAYMAPVPERCVIALLEAGLIIELNSSINEQFLLVPYAEIVWDIAGKESGTVVDPLVVISAKKIYDNQSMKLRC